MNVWSECADHHERSLFILTTKEGRRAACANSRQGTMTGDPLPHTGGAFQRAQLCPHIVSDYEQAQWFALVEN